MIGLSLLFNYAKSQNSNFDSKYDDPNFNALKVVKVIDECGFKPSRSTSDMRQFKSVILSLSDRAYQQINIDTWAICNKKREENYLMYNTHLLYLLLQCYNNIHLTFYNISMLYRIFFY